MTPELNDEPISRGEPFTPEEPSSRGETGCGQAGRLSSAPLGRVLILGLGKSGKSAARYCYDLLGTRVDSIFIAAGKRNADSESFVDALADPRVTYAFDDDALEPLVETGARFDLCIASPGIPYWHDLYTAGKALSREIMSEVEFAWLESAADSIWVAITGTNGKTTTTSCCAHVLRSCGYAASAVGNIGDVCLDAVAAGETSVYVAEVSSYQLYSTRRFTPDIAVMLNITPDHIHWHKTFEAYRDAKFNELRGCGPVPSDARQALKPPLSLGIPNAGITKGEALANVAPGSDVPGASGKTLAILDATNDVVRSKVRDLKAAGAHYIPMGTADGIRGDMRARCGAANAAFLAKGDVLAVALDGCEHFFIPASDLRIHGDHNASNALAAAAVAVALGADDEAVSRGLASFSPLEHRVEPCGTIAGVQCYNDSKATNVDATLKALQAFPNRRLIVLLGGDDKGTELEELVAAAHEHAQVVVCFGSAGPRFAEAFAASPAPEGFTLLHAEHMEDALDVALSHASRGDVLLLSPACASFDEFKSFEHRGRVFKDLVAARMGRSGDDGEAR